MENLSPMKIEVDWEEEECFISVLPLKDENCKPEEIPDSFGIGQSSDQGIEENVHSAEEMKFAFVDCEEGSDIKVHKTEILEIKEDIIIEDEKPLTSQLEEAAKLPPSGSKHQNEILPSYPSICQTSQCIPSDEQFHGQSNLNNRKKKPPKQKSSNLKNRKKRPPKQKYSLPCPKCEKKFWYRSKLNEHVIIHSNEKPFSCSVCDRRFTRNGDLKKHMFSHSTVRQFSCKLCDSQFKMKGALRTHMFIIHGSFKLEHTVLNNHASGNSSTSKQGDETALSSNLKIADIITMNEQFCYQCNELFSSQAELKLHTSAVHGRSICRKSFTNPVHSDKRNHVCKICKKSFSRGRQLLSHMREHPSDDNLITPKSPRSRKGDYQCCFCGKIYSSPSKLKEHLVSHTKEKAFTCNICKKSFSGKSGLKYHMARHTGDLLYSCPSCNKRFARLTEVKCHMASHLGHLFHCDLSKHAQTH